MKNKLKLLCCCITLLLGSPNRSYAQYVKDWKQAPENPVPWAHTLNHFNIKGDVTTREHPGSAEFFSGGNLMSTSSNYGSGSYIYNSQGYLSRYVPKANPKLEAKFTCDNQGRITELEYIRDGSGSKYVYNEKGLYSETRNRKTGARTDTYIYDAKGRIAYATSYSATGAILSKFTYTYSVGKQPALTVLQKYESLENSKDNRIDTMVYDVNGYQIGRNGKPIKLTFDAMGNIITSDDRYIKMTSTYTYTYGNGKEAAPPAAAKPVAPPLRESLVDQQNESLPVDVEISEEVTRQLKAMTEAQNLIKKIATKGLFQYQVWEILNNAEDKITGVQASLQRNFRLLTKREEMAKEKGYQSAIASTPQIRQKFSDANVKLKLLIKQLNPVIDFSKSNDIDWAKIQADAAATVREAGIDIINGYKICSQKSREQQAAAVAKAPVSEMKISEMLKLLTDLEMHRWGVINLASSEMRGSIDNDFYLSALHASGNQPLLQKLLTNERKRQLDLAMGIAGVIKQVDSAILITKRLEKPAVTSGYEVVKKDLITLYNLSRENGREIESNGDLSRKDATELMAIVQKTQPDMKKAHDLVFGLIDKLPPSLK